MANKKAIILLRNMKKLTLLLVLIPVFFGQAQSVTVSTRVVPEPVVDSKYFLPVTIYTKKDSVINGYAKLLSDGRGMTFVKEKKGNVVTVDEWKLIMAKKIKKAEFKTDDKTLELEPVKRKGDMGAVVLLHKMFENEKLKLYMNVYDIHNIERKVTFFPLKPGENKASILSLNFKDQTKSMPDKVRKVFSSCPELQKKIKNKEYKNTLEDFTQILEYFDKECF